VAFGPTPRSRVDELGFAITPGKGVDHMRTEMSHTYPIPLKKAFHAVADFRRWPDWYAGMTEILEPEKGRWGAVGDKVRFAYRLLGRRVEGEAIVKEFRELELVAFRTEVPGLPTVHFEYRYEEKGREAFVLTVAMETEEPTSFFGKAIDKMLLPRVLERDLRHSLENLDTMLGILEPA
jgi:hypothetical protein